MTSIPIRHLPSSGTSTRAPATLVVAAAARERELIVARLRRSRDERIEAAHDGAEAIRMLTSFGAPVTDLVICEPLPDGATGPLVRYARSLPGLAGAVRIVVVAQDRSTERAAGLYDAGADLVVTRPIDFDLLSRKLSALRRAAA